jgi:hypothetical protein
VVDPAGKLLGYRGADTAVTERKAAGQLIHRRQRQQTDLHRALELEVVAELFGGGFVRADIRKMQRAETCRTGILTQSSVQHTFKPVGGQVKAVEAAAIIVLSPSNT